MKKLLLIFSILLTIASCDKLPENGKLDGMWQITSINYAHNSVYDSLVNMKPQQVYLCIQLKLAQFRTGNYASEDLTPTVLSRFKKYNSTLEFYDFHYHNDSDRSDVLINDSTTKILQCLGINGINAKFHIDKLSNEHMKLSSDYAQIICRKF